MAKEFFRRLAIILMALAIHGATIAHAQEPDGFREMKWGTFIWDAKTAIQAQWYKRRQAGEPVIDDTILGPSPSSGRSQRLAYQDWIGGVRTAITLHFLDDKLSSVGLSFKSKQFDFIQSAFKERYGKPTAERTVPMKNGFGATFSDQRLEWRWENIQIFLTSHMDASNAVAVLSTKEWRDFTELQERQQKSKAANDL